MMLTLNEEKKANLQKPKTVGNYSAQKWTNQNGQRLVKLQERQP